jgi:hypothetical protein
MSSFPPSQWSGQSSPMMRCWLMGSSCIAYVGRPISGHSSYRIPEGCAKSIFNFCYSTPRARGSLVESDILAGDPAHACSRRLDRLEGKQLSVDAVCSAPSLTTNRLRITAKVIMITHNVKSSVRHADEGWAGCGNTS